MLASSFWEAPLAPDPRWSDDVAVRIEIQSLLARGDETAMRDVAELARADELDDPDIADLARVLAGSGAQLDSGQGCADLASTGGPSSLSTLVCPLHLRSRGLTVPKLGVRGRPAGGVDVLETIPGFRSRLDPDAAKAALERSRYVHLLADEQWAPLDARLFAYRQREGAQTIPALVIASILAKKLAAGVVGAGLEVRIAPHGNFGADVEEARRNARRYNRVATHLGMQPVCTLTDARWPYQPYIGRGEAVIALADILDGQACGWLAEHYRLCIEISDAVAGVMGVDVSKPVAPGDVRDAHNMLLDAHGSSAEAFTRHVEALRSAPRTTVRAPRAGVVAYDLERLRALLVARQRQATADDWPSDPAGVILGPPAGAAVSAGEPVIVIRMPAGERQLFDGLAACVSVGDGREGRGRLTLEVI